MESYNGKERKNSVKLENGIKKSAKEFKNFHPQSKLHQEVCADKGILETLCRNIHIISECLLLFLVCIWGFLIWFIGLFMCTRKKNVTGQLALITGGANGFGKELCLRFALEGCDVIVVDVDWENAKLVAEEIELDTTVRAKAYQVDVGNPAEVEKLKEKIIEDFGRSVDILVNNAGLMPFASFDAETRMYENGINVNLMAHIWMIRAFLPAMISNSRGHIVAVSSALSVAGFRRGSIYCSSKAAVRALMESLRDDLNMRNIKGVHTSCVMPYFMATEGVGLDRFKLLIPPLCPDKAAEILVDNVLRNNICFTIPKWHMLALGPMRILPEVVKSRVVDSLVTRICSIYSTDK